MHPTDLPPETGSAQFEDDDELPDLTRLRSRLVWILSGILVIVVLVFIPPLISVSRFQRRITANLSAALGRPVHLDHVSLTLFPLPGFTLDNFVVDEDPAFGYEPILRANEVRATVRISSLWSHHVEFSRISLSDPTSLNLVRLPDGRWNFEAVLLKASRIEAAPTAQAFAGPTPRFPYIEATGARINLKLGAEKTPFALTDSEFALWLPGPRQWRFRLDAHPSRTDVQGSDSGLWRIQGTLGDSATRAEVLGEVPIDVHGSWENAPLSGVGRLMLGRDPGLRGDITLELHAVGSIAHSAITAALELSRLRRADFVPPQLAQFQADCQALADNQFHSFTQIECHSPEPAVVIVTGAVPDVGRPDTAFAQATLPALPGSVLSGWLESVMSNPPALSGPGLLSGTVAWHAPGEPPISGKLELSGESVELKTASGPKLLPLGNLVLQSEPTTPNSTVSKKGGPKSVPSVPSTGFDLVPVELTLAGRQQVTVQGHFDRSGYALHLSGSAALDHVFALAAALPQLGDGLRACVEPPALRSNSATGGHEEKVSTQEDAPGTAPTTAPAHLDLTATRSWGKPQTWSGCVAGL